MIIMSTYVLHNNELIKQLIKHELSLEIILILKKH